MAGKKNVQPASLANLKLYQKGGVANPYGRGGKDGTKGLSLKTNLKNRLAKLSDAERESFFDGLLAKGAEGDVNAIKLMLMMNDEPLEQIKVEADTGVRISIQMPAKESDGSDV